MNGETLAPPGPTARRWPVPADPLQLDRTRWTLAVGVLLAASAGFDYSAAADAAFTGAHRLEAALAALLSVTAVTVLAHLILVVYQQAAGITGLPPQSPDADPGGQQTLVFRRRGIKGAVMGQDGRASTSKTQVALWTGAVVWALAYLLLLARSAPGGTLFSSAVNGSWRPEYLVLLGLPVAAAATAKAVVSGSNNGRGPVPGNRPGAQPRLLGQPAQPSRVYVRDPVPARVEGFAAGVAELMTADDNTVAWSDLQYTVFTLITLVYFAAEVIAQPASGLPPVPAALLTLMGVSASGYTAKKIVDAQGSVPTA
jgi:hypothetical protein